MYCEFILGQIPLNPATMSMYEPQLCDSDTALTHSLQSILTSTGSTTSSSELHSSVDSVAYTFYLQLTLCLRHAHRVLQAMDSCLSRALLCTVYVNLPQLQALQLASNSTGTSSSSTDTNTNTAATSMSIDEAAVIMFVRRLLASMHRSDIPTSGSSSAVGMEEEYDEYSDEVHDSFFNFIIYYYIYQYN